MTFSEYPMRAGAWSCSLVPETPRALLDRIAVESKGFSTFVVTPSYLDVNAMTGDSLLALARYVGVYRRQDDSGLTLAGAGLTILMGDEDGKGDVFETPRSTADGTMAQWFPQTFPPGITGIGQGTLTQPAGTSYRGSFFLVTAREAWDRLAEAFGVEYRITNTFTFDVGPVAALYGTTPTVAILGAATGLDGGRDIGVTGVRGSTKRSVDLEDYASKTVYVQGSSEEPVIGAVRGAESPVYKRPTGYPLIMDKKIEAYNDDGDDPGALASAQLGRVNTPRVQWRLDTVGSYDLGRDCPVGSPIWLYDPSAGLYDLTNRVPYRGAYIYPIQSRLMGLTSPIREGSGVYLRHTPAPGVVDWIDLTPYVQFEDRAQDVTLGAVPRR